MELKDLVTLLISSGTIIGIFNVIAKESNTKKRVLLDFILGFFWCATFLYYVVTAIYKTWKNLPDDDSQL
jgi:hypothetical protein